VHNNCSDTVLEAKFYGFGLGLNGPVYGLGLGAALTIFGITLKLK